jgi:hypothetical protein
VARKRPRRGTPPDWDRCDDPGLLFDALDGLASDRKYRLFAVACCYGSPRDGRRKTHPQHLTKTWEAVARFADGEIGLKELRKSWSGWPERPREWAATWAHQSDDTVEYQSAADILATLRDVFGNPFRPVAVEPGWRTGTAVALARQMYASRDFSLMPILADALQDAGCECADVLDHCRGDGPHVRGCWVIDLVLGKA